MSTDLKVAELCDDDYGASYVYSMQQIHN